MGGGASMEKGERAAMNSWSDKPENHKPHNTVPVIHVAEFNGREHDAILSPDPSYVNSPRTIINTDRSSKMDDNLSVHSLITEADDDIDETPPGAVPFQPPSIKRNELIPDANMFSLIDTLSVTVPKLTSRSPVDLAYHLSKSARNDLEKIRAFYVWITHNISYDTVSFFSGKIPPRCATQVLADGKGVCDHYSVLFQELCRSVDIPCIKMNGFAKGFGYCPDEPFNVKRKTTHSWNLVQIDQNWWPVDCTWGSGHVNNTKKFERFYQEFYFLPEPEQFILSHFPKKDLAINKNQTYQLLSHPVTLEEFNKSAKVEPGALYHGIKLSHKSYYFKAMKECDITLRAPTDTVKDIACHLHEKKSKKNFDNFIMCEKVDLETFNIHIRLPEEERYILEIYALPMAANTNSFDLVSEYCIRCDEVSGELCPYPSRFGTWGASPDSVQYGFMDDIFEHPTFESHDGTLDFNLNLCNEVITLMQLRFAESTRDMEEFIFCSYTASAMKISARLPYVGYYELNLFAQRPGDYEGKFDCIGHFLVHCKKEAENCSPFPMYYPGAAEYNCMLLEPLQRYLPANKEIKFRLTSSTLQEVTIETTLMDKAGSNTWTGSIFTCDAEPLIRIYGTDRRGNTHQCLYEFKVVNV